MRCRPYYMRIAAGSKRGILTLLPARSRSGFASAKAGRDGPIICVATLDTTLDSAGDFFYTRASTVWAQVAQLVEQRTENPRVGGSIPPLGTIS